MGSTIPLRPRPLPLIVGLIFGGLTLGAAKLVQAQSGFAKQTGALYSKLSYSTWSSNKQYSQTTAELNDRGDTLTQHSVSLYADYGLYHFGKWGGLSAQLSLPLVRINAYDTTTATSGVGDLSLGLKYGVQWGRLHLAVISAPEFPTGDSEATARRRDNELLTILLPTGDGEFNWWNTVAASLTVDEVRAYASVYGGLNTRSELSDEISLGGEIGHKLLDTIWLQARVRALFSTARNIETSFSTANESDGCKPLGFVRGECVEFVALGASVAAPIPRTPLWLTVDVDSHVAAQRNIYSATTVTLGLALDFNVLGQK